MTHTFFRRVALLSLGTWLLAIPNAAVTHAQGLATPVNAMAGPHLSAHGHAEAKSQADIAFLTISVTSLAHRESAAAHDNAARTAALLQAVKVLKIADNDIQTMDYTVARQFNSNRAMPTLIGYEVTNTVRVTLRDLAQVSRLVDATTQSGATRITGLTYDMTDRQALEEKVLALAVTDAHKRAEVIASAMSMVLGDLRSVTDGNGPIFQAQNFDGSGGFAGFSGGGAAPTPISPQTIVATADVTVDYALSVVK